jgi:ChpA-C
MMRKALLVAGAAALALGGTAGVASADCGAVADATGSPGVLSGDAIQVSSHLPIDLCGDSIDIVALFNPTLGNGCANH